MENPDYAVTVFYDDFETGSNWRDNWIPGNNGAFISPNFGNILIWKDSTATINQSLGKLSLIARGYEGYTTTDWNGDPITADYISGSVKSKDRFLYGVFECNATFGYKHGSFPAFWLYFDSICGYDYGSEIDIAELKYEESSTGLDNHAYYYPCASGGFEEVPGSWKDNDFIWSTETPHTFKCIWTPTKIEWYVDNTKKHTIYKTVNNHYPNKTMVMILCQQLYPYKNKMSNIDVPVTSTFHWVRAKEFFLAPEITISPNVICSSGTAALDVDPSADSITWSLTPTNLFSGIKIGTGKTATFTAASGASGQGKLTYTFKMPSGETFIAEKTFWVGKAGTPTSIIPFWNNGMEFGSNSVYEFRLLNTPTGATSYTWSVGGGTILSGQGTTSIYVRTSTVTGDNNINFSVGVRAVNICEESAYFVRTGWVISGTGGATRILLVPNPAIGETTLSIESNSADFIFDETSEWEFEIYDQVQTLKEKKTKIKGKEHQIQTAGWKEGVYFVRVKYKDEIITNQLVVKK